MLRRSGLALVLSALPLAAQAAPPRLVTETFFEMESLGSPAISPDGRQILFTRGSVDKVNDQPVSSVWITDAEGGRIRQLSLGPWRDSSPAWAPDGKRLAFLSDRDGTNQVYVCWLDTREVAKLTSLERGAQNLAWSPDGKRLAFTAFVPDDKPILEVKLPKRPEGAKWATGATVIDRLAWRMDGRGPLPKGYTHLFVVDATLGGTARQLTKGDYNHAAPAWSADGRTLYVSGIRKPDAEYTFGDSEIYAVDAATGETKALTDRKGPDGGPQPSPDGKWIAYTGFDEKGYTSHLSSLYLMDPQGGQKRVWATDLPSGPMQVQWAEDGSGVYYRMEEWGEANLYFQPLQGKARKLSRPGRVLQSFSVSKAGTVAATVAEALRPAVLEVFAAKKPEAVQELVDLNKDVLAGLELGPQEELRFKSPDGLDLQGWLIRPPGLAAGKKAPLLLWIHGGPWMMYPLSFNWAWQNFAAQGYAVLFMNPRGSTGYGQAFVNGIQYAYPDKDYLDLMAGVDAALAKGFIDADNLFVCGGSGGGVLTAWIVGHTNRFRAAASMRPVIDWMSFVGTTDMPGWYRQFRKMPWEDPLEYAQRSPLHYVANVQTPTLVMTGEADLRTPIGQSEEYYRALKMLKKDTLLVRMPDEYHGWRRPSHQLAQQAYLMAWFEKYRKK